MAGKLIFIMHKYVKKLDNNQYFFKYSLKLIGKKSMASFQIPILIVLERSVGSIETKMATKKKTKRLKMKTTTIMIQINTLLKVLIQMTMMTCRLSA